MRLVSKKRLHGLILGCSIVLLPLQQVLAAIPAADGAAGPTVNVVRDVALQAGNMFQGQVVDHQGAPCKSALVRLVRTDTGQALVGQTDDQGRFRFENVTAGVHRVETTVGAATYRLWAPNTAPPSAGKTALVIQGDSAVRGNLGSISPLGWTLIGLGVAAAIAIPVVLAIDDDDDAS